MSNFGERLAGRYETTVKDARTWLEPVFHKMQRLKDEQSAALAAYRGGYKRFANEDMINDNFASQMKLAEDRANRIKDDAIKTMRRDMAEIMAINGEEVAAASAVLDVVTDDAQILRYAKDDPNYSRLVTVAKYATDHDSLSAKNITAALRDVEDAADGVIERMDKILTKAIDANDDWRQTRWHEWIVDEDLKELTEASRSLNAVLDGEKISAWERLRRGVM